MSRPIEAGKDAGMLLAEMVKSAGVRGAKAIGLIRRTDAEVRVATLPSTELNELRTCAIRSPSLVRLGWDTWPIDFVVLSQELAASTAVIR